MKKITLLIFVVFLAIKSQAQCLGGYEIPLAASNNSGFVQQLSSSVYTTGDFITVTDLIVGKDYTFTCVSDTNHKYITITDANNAVLEHGASPLTLSATNSTTVRVHYSDNAECTGGGYGHTATIQMALTCPFPTALVISDVTTTTATLEWEPGASETAWEVIVLPASSPAPAATLTQGVTTINDNPTFSATLVAGTSYKFYYRAVCDATDKSPWNVSATFTTLCEDTTYFSEGFDTNTSLPNCYLKIGTEGNVSVQSDSNAPNLPNALSMYNGGILGLPSVSNFDAATHRIKFKLKGNYSAGGIVEFGFLTEAQMPSSFIVLQSFTAASTEYADISFEPGDVPETGYFAFRHSTANTNYILIDDIVWEAIPSCPDVAALKVDAFTSTTAALSWNSNESAFEVAYGVAATTANPNELTPVAVQETAVALSNLQPSTMYKVWVRSICAGNTPGAWIGPKLVTTTCTPVASFSENFNASSSIPACFKRVGTNGSVYVSSSAIEISSYMGETNMSYGILSLPAVNNAIAGTNRLKFNAKSSGGVIEIGYLTNPDNGATFTAVHSITVNSSDAFQSYIYIPAAGIIPAETMAFRHTGSSSSSVLIDDLIWEATPNCTDVASVQAIEISNASAKITWTGTTETNWQVAYGGTSVTDPNTLTPVAVSTVSNTVLNTLTASTTYKVWVRSDCDAQGFGAWIGPLTFATSCDAVDSFSEDFNASSNLPNCWTGTSGYLMTDLSDNRFFYMPADGVLAPQMVNNASAGTHRLKFKAMGMYGLGGTVEVGYMTSYNSISTFVLLESFTPTSTTVFEDFYANLGTLPTTGYLAIRNNGGASYSSIAVDDVVWEVLPLCEAVSNLTVNMVSNTTAAVSWTAVTSTAWEIAYTDVADPSLPSQLNAIDVTSSEYVFTELVSNAPYKFWVRANCGNGEFGDWIGPKEFRTTCDPQTDLPWAEDFESVDYPNLPTCWNKENGIWEVTNGLFNTNPHTGAQYIKVYNNVQNGYVWTPGFELEANTSYDFSAFVQGDGFDGWSVAMMVNTQPAATGATQIGAIYEVASGTGLQPHVEMKRTFTPTVSGTYFFAVKVNENSTGNPFWLAFDDFALSGSDLSNPIFDTNAFKAYPNPVKDILNLSYTQNITNVKVYNLLGQIMIDTDANNTKKTLDMSSLSSGNYIVKVSSNNQVQTIKIVKQ